MSQDTILLGERIPQKNAFGYGWRPLYNGTAPNPKLSDENLLGKKSIIFLPGDGTDSERGANACCRAVQSLLEKSGMPPQDMPHLYGLAYFGNSTQEHRYQLLRQFKQAQFGRFMSSEEEVTPYYQPFFDEYILPLMVNEQKKARSLKEIIQNIQNITFITHCHGGMMATQIEKMMADKLMELYPKQMTEIMGNVRMIHFSSRRPKGVSLLGKHLDILVHDDEIFADGGGILEYDDIHEQIHRAPFAVPSALIHISPNEEILVLKKVSNKSPNEFGEDFNHSEILQIFSGEKRNPLPENAPAIQLTRQLLRHFVEHPEDKKSVQEQLAALNPGFVQENILWGEVFFTEERQAGQMRRGLLSLVTDWKARLARHPKTYDANGEEDVFANDLLRQHDDQGRFLYDELKKRYQKDHNPLSLIHYLDATYANMPPKERGNLALLAIQNKDWKLFNHLGGKTAKLFYVDPQQLPKIISSVQPEDLYRLIPFLQGNKNFLQRMPKTMALLMRKTKRIKKENHQKMLSLFLADQFRQCFLDQRDSLTSLLQEASLSEKKIIKSALQQQRQTKARQLWQIKHDRDRLAPDLSIEEYRLFLESVRQWQDATLDDFRQFKTQKANDKRLTFDAFMIQKKPDHYL